MRAFTHLQHIIQTRRTVKPLLMNGKTIPEEQLFDILHLANWAPTHGLTEPWRFIVYGGEKIKAFCNQHADLYQAHTRAEKYTVEKYDKLRHMGDLASHIVVAVMQRGPLPAIPVLEEIAAAACAVQNMLLGATALGLASYWGSGGMAYHPAMKKLLDLQEEDLVLGILYLGYTDKQLTGRRNSPIQSKITLIQ
jgi:nitroreductase